MIGDPTEGALLVAAAKAWEAVDELPVAYPRHMEIPFDSSLKRMTTVHKITWIRDEGPSPFHDETHLNKHAIYHQGRPRYGIEACAPTTRLWMIKVLPLD